jgi:tetraacyldisaccharide 4'-kinase
MKFYKPLFWQKRSIISYILYPISLIVIFFNLSKKIFTKKKFKIKTICVGNIYLGGTGKTSLAIKLNEILQKKFKTVFIKKKYTQQIDEKKLLQENGNVIFLEDRSEALHLAEKKGFEIAILDDGLQQKDIDYDLSIVCFNSKESFGNGMIVPAGPLRENISEIKNYDIVFINGEFQNLKLYSVIKSFKDKNKIFKAKYEPLNLKKINLNKNYLLFSGVGNPHEFEKTLLKYKFKIKKKFIFPDHYKLDDQEISKIKKIAKKDNLDIITTEKDYLRLENYQKKNIKFLKVNLKINDIKNFKKNLTDQL